MLSVEPGTGLTVTTWISGPEPKPRVGCLTSCTPRSPRPECFYASFDEEWKVVAKCDRTKGSELRVVNWGNLARP